MQIQKIIATVVAFLLVANTFSQAKTDAEFVKILNTNQHTLYQQVLQHPQEYRLQIIYTQINRDKHNIPSFKNFYFNVDSLFYFNPASTVKLPLALLSLEKLNQMNIPGVNKFTSMLFDSAYSKQTIEHVDSSAQTGHPSIAQFIRKVFLVSDNDAYSRMYEFVGQQHINRALHQKGYNDVRITHRFVRMSPDENRHTNPIRFIDSKGNLIFSQLPAFNTDSFDFSHVNKVGKAHINWSDSLVNEPFDFTKRNNIALNDLHRILQSAMFPKSVSAKQRFRLNENDYDFVRRYMSQLPGETNYPKYDTTQYFDTYVKFFFSDSAHHHLPKGVRVFNKPGWAYGFMTDVAYVADFEHQVEFMLSATIYVNSDGVVNDNKYNDATVGAPFLYQLGQTIYQYELKRKRRYQPNLDAFKIRYETRDAKDKRPVIKDVEN
jgi:hypothetical protein